ncbi:hypothetical protein LEP1GSC024_4177 [Leptospira noguchii str. 2001034031]|uniref:Uncharacterized protein n=1 Tax=Leptospira noguchii str. 2001034031 TaxID=1193053 RepID=M6Y7K6_9LEPT|nr:hypothetical protein LEP1GSC024_4177 [Leptospira noguchii str. 2001034031]
MKHIFVAILMEAVVISSFVCEGSGLKRTTPALCLKVRRFLPLFVKEVD